MTAAAAPPRTDSHRLAVLDPADYVLVATEDRHPDEGFWEMVNELGGGARAMQEASHRYIGSPYQARHEEREEDRLRRLIELLDGEPDICRICGANHGNRWWGFFEHLPTGQIIQVGSKCAAKVGLADRAALEEVRAHDSRKMMVERGKRLAGDPAAQHAIEWCWRQVGDDAEVSKDGTRLLLSAERTNPGSFEVDFAADLLARFNRDAALSDKQIALIYKLEREAVERAERKAAEPEPQPIPADVLTGRAQISGTILSLKWKDDNYGGRFVTTIRDDRGFKVWGNATDPIINAAFEQVAEDYDPYNSGSYGAHVSWHIRQKHAEVRVAFTAAITASDDDETFGFFKRPTKVEGGAQ